MSSLVVRNAAAVVPLAGRGPVRGEDMARIEVLDGASVVVEDGLVAAVVDGDAPGGDAEIDASDCTVVPGFVDPHTHLPFYGWRADEDAARLTGLRYETLHRDEGGIYRSVRMLDEAGDREVLGFSEALARAMLVTGTTTFETKSGYGLSPAAELRQLRLARALSSLVHQRVVTTCLAAHAVPKGRTEGEWIGQIAEDILPRAVEEGLATAVDIYVESIAFHLEHAARLKTAADQLGLRMRVHADQLEDSQTGSFAARWGLATADHLNHTSLDAVGDIAAGDTVAVLLPGATFTLRQNKKPPARSLIEEGAVVALGTDLNPGTSPLHSMPFVIALACRLYGLRPLEALAAATVNAAVAIGLESAGRLQRGRPADLVVLDAARFEEVPYRPDHNHVLAVVVGGDVVYASPRAAERARGDVGNSR